MKGVTLTSSDDKLKQDCGNDAGQGCTTETNDIITVHITKKRKKKKNKKKSKKS